MKRARPLALALLLVLAAARPAVAEQLIISLSTHRVLITSNFTGAEVVLFGSIERDAATIARPGGYDIVVTVTGPRQTLVTRRKRRVLGIWVNTDARTFVEAPLFLNVLTNRAMNDIADAATLRRQQIGIGNILLPQLIGSDVADVTQDDPFRSAFLRLQLDKGHYRERFNAVTFLTPTLFRTAIRLPADVPIGTYDVDVKLFAAGALIGRDGTAFETAKVAFEQFVTSVARENGLLYGFATAMLALATGWLASVVFRRN